MRQKPSQEGKKTEKDPGVHEALPESFPSELLSQPTGARLQYFEQHCLIEHAHLLGALDATLQAICSPGEGATMRRPATMVLVIGPSRVGKTTLIRLLEEQLMTLHKEQMTRDSSFIPFASVLAAGPNGGPFDWGEYYRGPTQFTRPLRRRENRTNTSERVARSNRNGTDRTEATDNHCG